MIIYVSKWSCVQELLWKYSWFHHEKHVKPKVSRNWMVMEIFRFARLNQRPTMACGILFVGSKMVRALLLAWTCTLIDLYPFQKEYSRCSSIIQVGPAVSTTDLFHPQQMLFPLHCEVCVCVWKQYRHRPHWSDLKLVFATENISHLLDTMCSRPL